MFAQSSLLALLLVLPVALAQSNSSDLQPRIIGQKEHYLIVINDQCTGAVLSKSHIVTSATCALSRPLDRSFARYGQENSFQPLVGQKIAFKSIEVHPEFFDSDDLATQFQNNIAVIELEPLTDQIDALLSANTIYIEAQDEFIDFDDYFLMGFETNQRTCANRLLEPHRQLKLEKNGVCGLDRSAGPVSCATPKLANVIDCSEVACDGLLVQKRCYRGLFFLNDRVLIGVPTFKPRCDGNNQRTFVQVSKFSDWILRASKSTAKIFDRIWC